MFEKVQTLEFVPDQYKTQKKCERAAGENLWLLEFVPDHYKTREMCEKSVKVKG